MLVLEVFDWESSEEGGLETVKSKSKVKVRLDKWIKIMNFKLSNGMWKVNWSHDKSELSCWSIHLSHFITKLKIYHLYSLINTHDDFDSADPSNMKDACRFWRFSSEKIKLCEWTQGLPLVTRRIAAWTWAFNIAHLELSLGDCYVAIVTVITQFRYCRYCRSLFLSAGSVAFTVLKFIVRFEHI